MPAAAAQISEEGGSWSVICTFSHRATDDPIVHPGHAGASHLHDFFGNLSTDAFSTRRTLLAEQSDCSRAPDRSAYWVPTLERGASLGPNGEPTGVKPVLSVTYYRAADKDPRTIRPFPRGLRMVAGNPRADRPQGDGVASWFCGIPVLGIVGNYTAQPQSCASPMHLYGQVYFPDCSNGRVDSRDHKRHMAYASYAPGTYQQRTCPASHPIPVPMVNLIVEYPPRAGAGAKLASGGTYSLHADFFEAWRGQAVRSLIASCLQAGRACGEA